MLNNLLARAHVALLPRHQEGASAIEYGLILGLIAVAIVLVLGTVGDELLALFTGAATELGNATP